MVMKLSNKNARPGWRRRRLEQGETRCTGANCSPEARLLTLAALGAPGAAAALPAVGDLRSVARLAWLYGLPLIEVAAVRKRILGVTPANRLFHQRELITVDTQRVTSPNNDTLYSRAILDLSRGPVELTLPATGDRYLSVALMDMFTEQFSPFWDACDRDRGRALHHRRADRTGAWRDPCAGSLRVFLLARTLSDGPADLPAARQVQDGLVLTGPAGRGADSRRARRALGALAGVFRQRRGPPGRDPAAGDRPGLLQRRPAAWPDRVRLQPARLHRGRGGQDRRRRCRGRDLRDPDPRRDLRIGPRAGPILGPVSATSGRTMSSWAQIALTGLFALPVAEAIYTRSTGDDGTGLFTGDRYRPPSPAGKLLPVDAFWSLTAYKAFPEGQFLFAANAIDRYSIGDRTPGLG